MSNMIRKIKKNIMRVCWKCPHAENCKIKIGLACIHVGGTVDPKELNEDGTKRDSSQN